VPASRRLVLSFAISLVALGTALDLWSNPRPVFPLDDAYITLHNAQVLLSGSDTSFPGVPAVQGATSPAHLALVVLLGHVFPVSWAAWIAGWIAIALLATGIARWIAMAKMPLVPALGLLVVVLFGADTPYQLLNGIETGLAMAGIVWTFALHADPPSRRPWLVPVLAGQLPFLRPELGLLALALIVDRAFEPARVTDRHARFAKDLALAAAAASPWLVVTFAASGTLWPETIEAKRNFFAEGCRAFSWKLELFGRSLGEFARRAHLALIGLLLLARTRTGRLVAVSVVGFLVAFLLEFPGAPFHNDHRYLYPMLTLSAGGVLLAWREGGRWLRPAISAFLPLAAVASLAGSPRTFSVLVSNLRITTDELQPVARFVREQIPAAEPLLVHDIGYLSNEVPNRLVDLVGLKNELALDLHARMTWPSCGRSRAQVVEWLALYTRSRYLVMFSTWDQIFRLTSHLQALGWRLEPLRPPGVRYQVYRLTPPASPPFRAPP
jgi:hypothetical protein